MNMMPEGWRKAFGMQMVEELNEILVKANCVKSYRINQIKEKWGGLRWYDNFAVPVFNDEYYRWQRKYTDLAEKTCFICGNPATFKGDWNVPYCDDCLHGSRLRRNRKDD